MQSEWYTHWYEEHDSVRNRDIPIQKFDSRVDVRGKVLKVVLARFQMYSVLPIPP
jgi:hypothetical protein